MRSDRLRSEQSRPSELNKYLLIIDAADLTGVRRDLWDDVGSSTIIAPTIKSRSSASILATAPAT